MVSDNDPQEMRKKATDLLARSAKTSDQAEQRRLASRAFALAQLAEAAERSLRELQPKQPPTSCDLGLEENLRIVTENNVKRFVGCLYVETETMQRELYRNLLLREEQWFGVREERLEMLQRLVRDCDGQVRRQKAALDGQRARGLDVTHAETLMTNMLDTQALLRVSLANELQRD